MIDRLDQHMSVDAEDLAEKFGAETVHHRHDDDQGGDTKHDAGKRKSRDHGDEGFTSSRSRRYRPAIIHSKAENGRVEAA